MKKIFTNQTSISSPNRICIAKAFWAFSFCLLVYGLSIINLIAQPTKQWDKTIGGSGYDEFKTVQQTTNGGYIMGGNSESKTSGDKSEDSGGSAFGDFWIVKLNAAGVKEWDNTLGGVGTNNFTAVYQAADGGFIAGGHSWSNAGRDKTENSKGINDYWIIKLDARGNKVWDKTVGGPSDDLLWTLKPTKDGGVILGGESQGGPGGDKSQAPKGGYDFWVVKLDALGNKQWDKTIGGSGYDILRSIDLTFDGGYILGGLSASEASGDKSENSKAAGSTNDLAGYDYWVVKLNALGTKEWDKTIGGNALDDFRTLQQTKDGGYILAGESFSNISGDKSENSKGGRDYWVVKLNASGTKEWDKTFGGPNDERFFDVHQTVDGGSALVGTLNSLIKLNTAGNIEWEKAINGGTSFRSLDQTADGGYILGTYYSGNIEGDKTENSKGGFDYWVVKLSAAPDTRKITTSKLDKPGYCAGSTVLVPFTTTGSFSPGEIFIAQLSDEKGSFASPQVIGSGSQSPIKAEIDYGARPGTGYRIRVVSSLSPIVIGADNSTNIGVSGNALGELSLIDGPTEPCLGTTAVYTLMNANDYKNFIWAVPTGWTILSGQGTRSITVTVGSSAGNIQISGEDYCGTDNGYHPVRPIGVPFNQELIMASTSNVCAGATINYSIQPKDPNTYTKGNYRWMVPSDWIIITGQGTTSISVIAGITQGIIEVVFVNHCGATSIGTLSVFSSQPEAPKAISKSICGPGQVTLSATGAPSTGSYRWYPSNSGGTPVSTNAIFTTPVLTTSTTYYVSVVNGSCESTRVPVTATVNPIPKIVVTTNATTITSGGTATLTASGASTYVWSPATGLSSTTGASVVAKPTATTTYQVTGTNANGCSSNATITITVNTSGLQMQTITFPPIPNKIYGEAPFSLNATSTSGLSPYYRIISGPATVSGSMLTITGVGTVTVRAYHPGNDRYLAATPVDVSFNVLSSSLKQSQSISFSTLPTRTFGEAPFTVSATASSGLPVSFTILSGPASITGNTVTLTGAGIVTVRATQAGNTTYAAANPVDQSFTVNKAFQTIAFASLPNKTFGDAPFTIVASATSNLPVSFAIISGPATLTGNLVTITGAGTVTVQATQAGNTNYLAATLVQRSFVVDKANQTVTLTAIPDKVLGDAPFALSATTTSGLPVSFSIVSGPATLAGNVVTLTGVGTVTVRAAQPGNINYYPGTTDKSFAVNSAGPTPTTCSMALTSKVTQAESWYGMWGATTGAGAIDLTVSGGTAPYTYKWNTGATTQDILVAAPAQYSVTVTDAKGCSAKTIVYVGRMNDPLKLGVSQINVSVAGGRDGSIDLSVIGGGGSFKYRWTNGALTEDLTGLAAGLYTVTVTDAFGRTATISAQILAPGTTALLSVKDLGIMEEALIEKTNLLVYPNPATNLTKVAFDLQAFGNYTLDLFDSKGAKVKVITVRKIQDKKTMELELNVAGYPEGVYLLRVIMDKVAITKRMVISR